MITTDIEEINIELISLVDSFNSKQVLNTNLTKAIKQKISVINKKLDLNIKLCICKKSKNLKQSYKLAGVDVKSQLFIDSVFDNYREEIDDTESNYHFDMEEKLNLIVKTEKEIINVKELQHYTYVFDKSSKEYVSVALLKETENLMICFSISKNYFKHFIIFKKDKNGKE